MAAAGFSGNEHGTAHACAIERSRKARWIHGAYSWETRELLAENRRWWKALLARLASE
jgi:hypothetical protein